MRCVSTTTVLLGAALATACEDKEPTLERFVAIRGLGGDWNVLEHGCDTVIDLPTDAPYEAVAWTLRDDVQYGLVTMYQAGPGDAVDFVGVIPCDEPEVAPWPNVIGASRDEVSYSASAGRVVDIVAHSISQPPRYLIYHDLDVVNGLTLDFDRDRRLLEMGVVTFLDGTSGSSRTTIHTPRGARHEIPSAQGPLIIPPSALADGDLEYVTVDSELGAFTRFDVRASPVGPWIVTRPPTIDSATWSPAGVALSTTFTFNEWKLEDEELVYCENACQYRMWRLYKTRGWAGVVTGSTNVGYPDVSSIPGFDAGRPSPGLAQTRLVLCENVDATARCVQPLIPLP